MRLAERTQVSKWWSHGESDEAECETACDWQFGPGKMRVVEYAARRHVAETGHVVIQYRTTSRPVFPADGEIVR